MGKNIFQDEPEDIQAKAIIEMNKNLSKQILAGGTVVQDVTTNNTTTNNTYNNIIIMSNEEDLIKLMSGQSSIPENTNIRVIEAEKPKEIIENEPLQIEQNEAEYKQIPTQNEEITTQKEEEKQEAKVIFTQPVKRTPRPSTKPIKSNKKKEEPKSDDYDDDDEEIEPGGGVTFR